MGPSWRRNTVGCTVEPLDGYGWFLGSLTRHAPFPAGQILCFLGGTKGVPRGIASHRHVLCPRAMPSAPPCRARLELVTILKSITEPKFPKKKYAEQSEHCLGLMVLLNNIRPPLVARLFPMPLQKRWYSIPPCVWREQNKDPQKSLKRSL